MTKKSRGSGSRKHSGGPNSKIHKQRRRGIEFTRRDDLVYEDLQAIRRGEKGKVARGVQDDAGLRRTEEQAFDVDLPGGGQFYCVSCARYFVDGPAHASHNRTKEHRRKYKELSEGERPHNQRDADAAAGMAAPDNGKSIRKMDQ